jgi:hypothetical protein
VDTRPHLNTATRVVLFLADQTPIPIQSFTLLMSQYHQTTLMPNNFKIHRLKIKIIIGTRWANHGNFLLSGRSCACSYFYGVRMITINSMLARDGVIESKILANEVVG